MTFGVRKTWVLRLPSPLYQLPSLVWPWSSYSTLWACFLICKLWKIVPTSSGFLWTPIYIKCLAHPRCVIKRRYYYTMTFCSLAVSVSTCSVVLLPKSVPQSAVRLCLPSLASTCLLHIQGHYLNNSSPYPRITYFFFHFLLKQFHQDTKILLYCYFSHLKLFLWSSLPCQPLTYFFAPLCSKILETIISTHCLQFPFYHSPLNTFQSILWLHQSFEIALIIVADHLCIAGHVLIQTDPLVALTQLITPPHLYIFCAWLSGHHCLLIFCLLHWP